MEQKNTLSGQNLVKEWNVPDDFLYFYSEFLLGISGCTFCIRWSQNNTCMEVKNYPPGFWYILFFWFSLLYIPIILLAVFFYWIGKPVVLYFTTPFMLLVIVCMSFVNLYCRNLARKHWRGDHRDIRFSCDAHSGDLYISKENISYHRNEYQRYLFVLVSKIIKTGSHSRVEEQLLFLIQLTDGTWRKYLLSQDWDKMSRRSLKQISQRLQCPVIIKDQIGKMDVIIEKA